MSMYAFASLKSLEKQKDTNPLICTEVYALIT